jgi:DNA gyrase subunit A
MRFREGDELLAMELVRPDADLVVATSNGYVKRTPASEYRLQGRAGFGTIAAKTTDERGELVGAAMVVVGDQLYAITSNGGVIRTVITTTDPRPTKRDTMGVRLIDVADGDSVVAIARNAEASTEAAEVEPVDTDSDSNGAGGDAVGDDEGDSGGSAGNRED